MGLYFTR